MMTAVRLAAIEDLLTRFPTYVSTEVAVELAAEVRRLRAALVVLADPAEAARLGRDFGMYGSAGATLLAQNLVQYAATTLGEAVGP